MKTLNEYIELAQQAIPEDTLNKERKVKIKASKDFLHENLPNLLDTDIKEAVTILVGRRGNKSEWMGVILDELMNKGAIDEVAIFKTCRRGRPEMQKVIKYALTKGITIELIDGEYIIKDVQDV